MKHVLVAGCGDLGTRLGLRLAAAGARVSGIRYSAKPLPEPLITIQADLGDSSTLFGLPEDVDTLVFAAAARERSAAGYQRTYVDGMRNVLDTLPQMPQRVLMVSSTAVYGQCQGEWVDETSSLQPQAFNGQVMLEAEQLLQARCPGAVIARLSGIYGPGRSALLRRVQGGAGCQAQPPLYSNRIHVDDAARALQHLLQLPEPAPVYIVSDSSPSSQCEVMDWLAARQGLPLPARVSAQPAGQGKRLRNRRLLDSGFALQYPDYRLGYASLINGMGTQ